MSASVTTNMIGIGNLGGLPSPRTRAAAVAASIGGVAATEGLLVAALVVTDTLWLLLGHVDVESITIDSVSDQRNIPSVLLVCASCSLRNRSMPTFSHSRRLGHLELSNAISESR